MVNVEAENMSQMTKKALAASMKKLMLEKPFTKITVSDIAEDCGINRMTFYYHFKDIYDLVEWSCMEDASKALKGKKTYETWQEGFLNIFNGVIENKPFIVNVYRCVSREQIERYLYQLIHNLVIDVVEDKAVNMTVSEKDKQFIANFYEYAFVGIMLEWIADDMKEDPKYIVDRVGILVHGEITRALNQFRTDTFLPNSAK